MPQALLLQEDLFGAPSAIVGTDVVALPTDDAASEIQSAWEIRPGSLDLFTGMGGIALGFAAAGAPVVGVDNEPWFVRIYRERQIGRAVLANLMEVSVLEHTRVLTGGPPCTPWSVLSQQARGREHPDEPLLDRFFQHVVGLRPAAFLMENVPGVDFHPSYQAWLARLERHGYSCGRFTFCYAHFGAATARQRLFTFGFLQWRGGPLSFLQAIRRHARTTPTTVEDMIGGLRDVPFGGAPDHVWPELKTIAKYHDKYDSQRYGWYRLAWKEPAPSFGNVTKTYVLHPDSGPSDAHARVLSVRELALIMGFPEDFRFPEGMPLSLRYQMLANAVSPVFSRACATVLLDLLDGHGS